MEESMYKKTKIIKLLRILIFVYVIIGIFSFGFVMGFKKYDKDLRSEGKVTIDRINPETMSSLDFSLFWRVWDAIETKYYDKSKLNDRDMVFGAIRGMVAAVGDPYTVFLPPEENKVVREDLQGSFSGVGIQIGYIGKQLAVMSPLPESPAEKEGILAGDYIIGIIDKVKNLEINTQGISLPEAVQYIRGESGTKVTLLLTRDGVDEAFEKEIARETIDVPSVTLTIVGGNENIAHLRILKFSGETKTEWDQKITELLLNNKINSIILDVRGNPGGYLQGAVQLASDFVDPNMTVVIEDKGDGNPQEMLSQGIKRLGKYDLVILINKGSASASEILAGALRDINKTQLIGSTTFGKGTIQEPQQIDGFSGLHITISKWLTPNKTWVNHEGLKPDIEVTDNPDTPEDEQLQKAIDYLTNK